MASPVNALLNDPEFSTLEAQDQEDVLRQALRQDQDFLGLPDQDQSEVVQDLLRSARPQESTATLAQKAKGAAASLGRGILSLPEELAGTPIFLGELASQSPGLSTPLSLPAEEPQIGQPTPLTPPTGQGFQEFATETGLPTSSEAMAPIQEFFGETREQFEQGPSTLSRPSIRSGLGVEQLETQLGIPEAIEESQLSPAIQATLEVGGAIAPFAAGKKLGQTLKKSEGIQTGNLTQGKGITSKPLSTSPVLKKDQVVQETELSPPRILPQEGEVEQRIVSDMVTRDTAGVYEPAFSSPLYDIKPARGKVKRNILGLDALSRIDRMPGLRGAGEFLRRNKAKWEQRTMSTFVDLDKNLTNIWGKRSRFSPQRLNPFYGPGLQERYRMSRREVKALVNYMYKNGDETAMAGLSEQSAQKVRMTGQLFFEQATKIRNQQAIDLGITVRRFNFRTGRYEDVPRTMNSMFFPHVPVNAKAKDQINQRFLEQGYQSARRHEPALSRAEFAKRIEGYMADNMDPKKFRGLEAERMFDAAEAGAGDAWQGLHEYGYETDPLRAILHYVGAADRRIVMEETKDTIAMIRHRAWQQGEKSHKFVHNTIERMQGAMSETIDKQTDDWLARLRSINTGTLLQGATLSNINQLNFIANKAGLLNTIKAATGRAIPKFLQGTTTRQIDEVVQRSGAIFNQIAAEFSKPGHAFSRYAQAQLFLNGFSATERWMRAVAAHAGVMDASQLIRKFKTALDKGNDKTARKFAAKLGNLGVDPVEIQAQGFVLNEQQALNVAQRVANQSTGRRDVGGVPLLVDSDNTFIRSFLQFKDFAFSNLAEMNRQIRGEPTKATQIAKLAKLMGGGEVMGEITRDLQQIAFNSFSGDIDLSSEARVPKFLRDTVGNQWGRVIDNELAGLSSVFGIAMLAMLKGEQAVKDEIFGPTGDLIGELYTIGASPFTGDFEEARNIAARRLGGPPVRNALREESTPGLRKFRQRQDFGGFKQ